MRLVEIVELSNGGHNNVCWDTAFGVPPEGWAAIPNDMVCENFPFGKVEVEEVDGVMIVTKWTPGVMPATEPETDATEDNPPSTLPDTNLSD